MSRDEAEALGAMALFGEKYGDWVRVVEVEGVSRELCGGTHVANTAEIGILAIVSEGSSAANVRRIEALTGPAAIDWYRAQATSFARSATCSASSAIRSTSLPAAEQLERAESRLRGGGRPVGGGAGANDRRRKHQEVDGIAVLIERTDAPDSKLLLQLAERIKSSLGDAAVVLGSATDGRVALVASFTDAAVERGLSAADVVREAAEVVGGGGGGRPNVAQAGGRDTGRLDEALEVARKAIERRLGA